LKRNKFFLLILIGIFLSGRFIYKPEGCFSMGFDNILQEFESIILNSRGFKANQFEKLFGNVEAIDQTVERISQNCCASENWYADLLYITDTLRLAWRLTNINTPESAKIRQVYELYSDKLTEHRQQSKQESRGQAQLMRFRKKSMAYTSLHGY